MASEIEITVRIADKMASPKTKVLVTWNPFHAIQVFVTLGLANFIPIRTLAVAALFYRPKASHRKGNQSDASDLAFAPKSASTLISSGFL